MNDRGIAIVVVMTILALVAAVVASLVLLTSTDVQVAAAFRSGIEARYAADAAANRALIDLAAVPDWTAVLDGSARSGFVDGPPGGVRWPDVGAFVDLDLVRSLADCSHVPPCSDAELDAVTSTRPWGVNNPRWQLYAYGALSSLLPAGAAASRWYVVVLTADDPAEQDGNPQHDDVMPNPGAGVLLLRAEAFGLAGAHAAVELLVSRAGQAASGLYVLSRREVS